MSDRSTGVILLGILAVAGLGLSGYMFLKNEIIFPSNTVIKHVWYDEKLDSIYFVPGSYDEIPDLNVLATVNAGEFLYLSFNAHAAVYGNGGPNVIVIKIKINDIIYDHPFVEIGITSAADDVYSPIHLQYSNRTMPAGIHNITICAFSSVGGNWIKDPTLLVYTYV